MGLWPSLGCLVYWAYSFRRLIDSPNIRTKKIDQNDEVLWPFCRWWQLDAKSPQDTTTFFPTPPGFLKYFALENGHPLLWRVAIVATWVSPFLLVFGRGFESHGGQNYFCFRGEFLDIAIGHCVCNCNRYNCTRCTVARATVPVRQFGLAGWATQLSPLRLYSRATVQVRQVTRG